MNKPLQRLTFDETRQLLRKSRGGLYKLMRNDPTFAKPLKDGTGRSARVFFIAEEIAAWQAAQLAARDAENSKLRRTAHEERQL